MQRRGRRASPPPPPPLPLRLLPSCPFAPGPLPGLARSPARALLAALPSLPPRRWLRALSSCQSVSPGRGPIALELLPRRLGLGCRCRRRRRSPAGPAARWLARAPARPPGSACAALCASGTAAAAAAAGLLGAQPNVATRARKRGGRQRPAIDGRFGQSARGGGPGGPGGTPCQRPAAAVPAAAASTEPLPLLPRPSRGCPGARASLFCRCGEGTRVGLGEALVSRPRRRGGLPGALRAGDTGGAGGAAAASEGRGRGPLSGEPPAPSRHVPLPYLPLTFPARPKPAQPLSPPPPRPPSPPGLRPRPPPQTPVSSPAAPPPALPLAQSAFQAPGPGLHAASWAARAGAEARDCSFTTSLKYFGKPQSGAARKRSLACFGEPGGGDGGLVLREGRVLPNF